MQTINTTTAAVSVEQIVPDDDTPPAVQLIFQTALIIQTPAGIMPVPYGSNTVEMVKHQALEFAESVREAAEALPDPRPHIDVASSLEGVDQVAAFEREIRNGS